MGDLIPVRDDEGFNLDRLVEWMEDQPDLPAGTPRVEQFSGGKANLTYLLTFPGGPELVLRRPPLGPVAPGSHDMAREFRVLSRLWRAFPRAPRALAYSRDDSVIGSPFLVMERRDGVVVREVVPPEFGGGEEAVSNRKLSEVVVDTLAEFHDVDAARAGLGDLGHPEDFLTRQVEGWTDRWNRAKDEEDPVAEEVVLWLEANLPDTDEVTLLHNDWRLDNMAVSPDDPGLCVAVYDWDMATRGDPLADVGTLMASWYDPGEERSVLNPMPTESPGWLDRSTALARYGEKSGRDLTAVDWYIVFGTWKLGIVLQQIYIRWVRGQTRDSRFSVLGEGARTLFRVAARRRG
ncbi:MAG TPA: phosphotransferase family protein [Acidimicrobiia bacterium]|nr:phosphotransferase family protein [Acidimicrobiia bacterium]